ncbi:hypothetical protein PUNSTDRAFT_143974 [Punctularia strigosozonata HHB-11173 SS5]|uniref:uncharacterized protein n=1 Tax=Punctularia strigosozonata (strain HHB-11173) TaxID=741275 RepID=UPI00044170F6|nr:uncharacterized protein PUNSTDRAFT_143974 [Punctularia strigosozonata HHB-11173 SS5]EIN08355.1 hypothetical protein PUNSTDRAFT_143974 [Punctularia strigosozonata HHB-11173 SS5]
MYEDYDDIEEVDTALRNDPRAIAINRFHRHGRGTWRDLKRATMQYDAVDDGCQEILHRIIAEEIVFSRHMEYAVSILLPSIYNARPNLAPASELADFVGTVFFNMHRISEGHHALAQRYREIQIEQFPVLDAVDVVGPLTYTIVELQSVYSAFLAHNLFALSKLEVEETTNSSLRAYLSRMTRAPSSCGQDLHTLLSAPGLHLNSICQHLSSLLEVVTSDTEAEEILVDIAVLTALQDIEPAPASEDEKEFDRLETRERSLLGKSVWEDDDDTNSPSMNEVAKESQSKRDFWFLHPSDEFGQAAGQSQSLSPPSSDTAYPQKVASQIKQYPSSVGRPSEATGGVPPLVARFARPRLVTVPAVAGPSTFPTPAKFATNARDEGLGAIKREAQARFARQQQLEAMRAVEEEVRAELHEPDHDHDADVHTGQKDDPRGLVAIWQAEGEAHGLPGGLHETSRPAWLDRGKQRADWLYDDDVAEPTDQGADRSYGAPIAASKGRPLPSLPGSGPSNQTVWAPSAGNAPSYTPQNHPKVTDAAATVDRTTSSESTRPRESDARTSARKPNCDAPEMPTSTSDRDIEDEWEMVLDEEGLLRASTGQASSQQDRADVDLDSGSEDGVLV